MTRPHLSPAQLLAAALVAAALAGCGDKKPATQVAAKVNQEELTVHQLNNELAKLRGLNEEQRKAATRQVLDRLIDQELLVQRAMERKLDRDPRVMQAIEASRRQILAQAYLESISAQAAKPPPDEVRKFYTEHPELFSDRKIYRLQELAIGSSPGLTSERVQEELKKAKSLNDVVEWLKRDNIRFNANSTVKAAEQLPMEVVPRLAALKAGQAMLMPSQQGYLIVQVASAEPQPLTEEQARPFIEQFLTNQKRRELAQAEIRSLKDAAKIEYVGDFASAAAAPAAAAPAAASPAQEGAQNPDIERGVKGLK